jgi:hypothetical protein
VPPADGVAVGSTTFKQVAGGLAIALLILGFRLMPSRGDQALRHDHRRDWSYVRVPHTDATPFERRLGEIASLVAKRPVQVRCEDFPIGASEEPGGVVQFSGHSPADYARIRPDVCTQLLKFVRAPGSATVESAVALDVLAHESVHLSGNPNEAVTECYSMQEVPRVARALGASEPESHALARVLYLFNYPKMPASYRSPDCRAGGPLDRQPGGGWPG